MQNLEILQALSLSATDGIVITDASGKIVLSNPAALRLTGYAEAELIGQPLEILMAKSRKNPVIENISQAKKSVLVGKKGKTRLQKKDGVVFGARMIISRVAEAGPYYAAIIQEHAPGAKPSDVAATIAALENSRAEISESLSRAQEDSQQKSRFVALASHEFRTPLSSIQLSASVIEHYFDRLDRNKIFGHLRKIASAVADMTGTLNDLLSLEKIESGHMMVEQQAFSLAEFCRRVAEELREHLKPGQRIHQEHGHGEAMVCGDEKLLRHCLVNLLSNAIKYSPENSVITLDSDVTAEVFWLRVSDQGLGIPAEEQGQLFAPFFRASNVLDIPGTGLGLSIVKKCSELTHGSIAYQSAPGLGSAFTLTFPQTVAEVNTGP